MTLHPFRSAVSAYIIYPLIRYFSGIQQHYWLQNRRGLRPGASGKSQTGDCALLCAVLDTSPVVYNPQRLVHEVNNLWRSSQRAQRSNSSNLNTEKIWTYDRTYKELLLACAANCVAGTVAGTILAITCRRVKEKLMRRRECVRNYRQITMKCVCSSAAP